MAPGYGRVQAICAHVHSHLQFQYGSSTSLSTAADVNASGRSVCPDFTHLAFSFCRALNIPARYIFGYLPDLDVPPDPAPMDLAAWMEVWLDHRWRTFDPRNNSRRKRRIVTGRGRDASMWPWPPPSAVRCSKRWRSKPRRRPDARCPGDQRTTDRPSQAGPRAPTRVTYLLEQGFRYEYETPVASLRQRLVVVPKPRHGRAPHRCYRRAEPGPADYHPVRVRALHRGSSDASGAAAAVNALQRLLAQAPCFRGDTAGLVAVSGHVLRAGAGDALSPA
jgi:hypothetical protein